jgi:AraC-like DNA-binding protein
MRLLTNLERLPLHGLIEREIIFQVCRARGCSPSRHYNVSDQEPPNGESNRLIKDNYAKPPVLRNSRRSPAWCLDASPPLGPNGDEPAQYQKQIRLQEARGTYVDQGLDAGALPLGVGYSASQFSPRYKRYFGQTPMRDTRTLRRPMARSWNRSGLVTGVGRLRYSSIALSGPATVLAPAMGGRRPLCMRPTYG